MERWASPPGHHTDGSEKRHRSIPALMEGQKENGKCYRETRIVIPSGARDLQLQRLKTSGLKTIEKINSANLWPIFDRDHKLQSRPDLRHRANFYIHQAAIKPALPNRVSVEVSRNA